MRSMKQKLVLAVAALVAYAVVAFGPFAIARDRQESSLLLNPPIQSTGELPALPPPTDPEAAAPRPRTTFPRNDEILPIPTNARRTSVNRPFMRPVEQVSATEPIVAAPSAADAQAAPSTLPAPLLEGPIVHRVADIKYDTDRDARKLFDKSAGVIETVMITQNPADGCFYEIPLCLPACCVGEPEIDSGRGLLGRGVVEYCWPCGLEVEVIFRLRGDVKVEYDG